MLSYYLNLFGCSACSPIRLDGSWQARSMPSCPYWWWWCWGLRRYEEGGDGTEEKDKRRGRRSNGGPTDIDASLWRRRWVGQLPTAILLSIPCLNWLFSARLRISLSLLFWAQRWLLFVCSSSSLRRKSCFHIRLSSLAGWLAGCVLGSYRLSIGSVHVL